MLHYVGETVEILETLHTWDCPVLQGFWDDIKKEIDTMLEIDVALEPKLFLLDTEDSLTSSEENNYSKLERRKTSNYRSMDPETEKCLFNGKNDGQSAAEDGHF